jgi:flagellar hook protein FlgE
MTTLTGIMTTGLLGMNAQGTALSSISANIANVNSTGYKESDTRFATLLGDPDNGFTPNQQAGGFWQGVNTVQQQQIDRQGDIQGTVSLTDFAIDGRGFFGVASAIDPTTGSVAGNGQRLVTRAGNFQTDKNGFLVNQAGNFLLGIPLTGGTGTLAGTGGNQTLSSLQPVKLSANATDSGRPTTLVRLFANLPATDSTSSTPETLGTEVFDSAGNGYNMTLAFTKTGTTDWSMNVQSVTPLDTSASAPTVTVTPSPVAVTFDGDGQIVSPTDDVSVGTFSLSNGASLDFQVSVTGGNPAGGHLTQLDDQMQNGGVEQDGAGPGSPTGFRLSPDGILTQTFSNGQSVAQFQVPLVTYVNPDGLEQFSGTAFLPTADSGPDTVVTPQQGGGGILSSSQLESSNVDLTDQFADLIVTQRAFSASSKIISTADQMYETVAQMKG